MTPQYKSHVNSSKWKNLNTLPRCRDQSHNRRSQMRSVGWRLLFFFAVRSLLTMSATEQDGPHAAWIRSMASVANFPALTCEAIKSQTIFFLLCLHLHWPLSCTVNSFAAFHPPMPLLHSSHGRCKLQMLGDTVAVLLVLATWMQSGWVQVSVFLPIWIVAAWSPDCCQSTSATSMLNVDYAFSLSLPPKNSVDPWQHSDCDCLGQQWLSAVPLHSFRLFHFHFLPPFACHLLMHLLC